MYIFENEGINNNVQCVFQLQSNIQPGPEILIDGDFSSPDNWNESTNWVISGGAATCDGTQTAPTYISQPKETIIGKTYLVTISNNGTGGDLKIWFDSNLIMTITSVGTFKAEIVATAVDHIFYIGAGVGFSGSIDNASCKELNNITNFADTSRGGSAHTITANGNVRHTTDQSKFTPSSIYFPNNGYLSIANSNNFNFGLFDFIISFWLKTTQSGIVSHIIGRFDYDNDQRSWVVSVNSFNKITFAYSNFGTLPAYSFESDEVINDNSWHHVCVSRLQNNIHMVIDSVVQSNSLSNPGALFDASTELAIGTNSVGHTNNFIGNLQDINIEKGRGIKNFNSPTRMT